MNAGADEPPRGQGQQMADADFDGLGGGFSSGRRDDRLTTAKAQRLVTLAGAAASLALVVGFGIWGYRLAVRDVLGVPVIQALDGPMRVAPDDPGGEIADHQGLAVNGVAAVGTAAPLPEKLALAPRPVDLAEEDAPGLVGLAPLGLASVSAPTAALMSAPVSVPGEIAPVAGDLALAATPLTESASPTAVAVDAALAEALGLAPSELASSDLAPADPSADPVAAEPLPGATDALAAEPAPEGAITLSPRPRSRPTGIQLGAAPAAVAALALAAPAEVDPATIPAGTRLVQFGAFNTADEARTEWALLQGRFGELMDGKGLVLQPAESGGRTFYRLRAAGFDDEDDARRFCAAFVAQSATCIPVPQR